MKVIIEFNGLFGYDFKTYYSSENGVAVAEKGAKVFDTLQDVYDALANIKSDLRSIEDVTKINIVKVEDKKKIDK